MVTLTIGAHEQLSQEKIDSYAAMRRKAQQREKEGEAYA